MRSFINRLTIFLIPLAVLILFFEIYLTQVDTVYKRKIAGLEANADSLEVLILGDSHPCYALNPGELEFNAFNVAQPNQSLYFDKRLTLKYIDRLPNLKFVLISFDFHSLYFSSQGIRDYWSYYATGITNPKMKVVPKISHLAGYTPKVAWLFLKSSMRELGNETPRPVDMEDGVEPYDPADKGWLDFEGTDLHAMTDEMARARAAIFNKTVLNSNERASNLADLDDFITELRKRGLTPILLSIPVYEVFARSLDKQTLERNRKDVDFLVQKHGLPFWDADSVTFDKADFYNSDHLNRRGAAKFSKSVNLKLKALIAGQN